MANPKPAGQFGRLFEEFKAGEVTRRQFLARAATLGVGASVATFVANSHMVAGAPARPRAGWATVHQDGAAGAPAVGTEGRTRGAGGELRLLQWQAPTTANGHVATGTKDQLAASPVLEPLMNYLPDGSLIPKLITEVPTVENGLLKEDLTGVTFKLTPGILWSDGTPLTAEDVVFTWNWIVTDFDTNSSVSFNVWNPITSAVAVDELTVEITYANPNVAWYTPFTGTTYGFILPKHILEAGPEAAAAFQTAPIGTGPYVVESFSVNDQVIYRANPNFRDPNKPFFETVNLKGGGDAASAARAVLQTGDWDMAWNLQVEPAVLEELMSSAEQGTVVAVPGTSVERININFSDPNTEVNGERSQKDTPHPFLTDSAVRQAMNLAVDRDTIATQFYGAGEPGTSNILTGVPSFDSPNTSYSFDLEQAKQILEDAGWTMDGDTRVKDGVELKVTYSTTINPVRQKTQAVVKQGFEEIGIGVSLQQIDSGIFFDGSPGNEQNASHMYVDINMYTNGATEPTPIAYMATFYAGPDGQNISQKSNNWLGTNNLRWANAEYDALYDQLRLATDLEAASQLLIQMNDVIIREIACIPQVNRAADKYAISNRLVPDNVAVSPFEYNYWNIGNWVTVE